MFKLFLLLSLWAAFACAAPSILSSSSLHGGYHGGWPAVQVVRPIWTTTHRIVQQPIIHSGLHGLRGGHGGLGGLGGHGGLGGLGGGYGHGWL